MKIIIEIPEEDVIGISNLTMEQLSVLPSEVAETLMRIKNGTLISDDDNCINYTESKIKRR